MKQEYEQTDKPVAEKEKTCLIVLPTINPPSYESGHFWRVYYYIIKPACLKAGFSPEWKDDASLSNHISINKLKDILSADLAIFDLSARDSDVLYKLGIRQGFGLPTVLIKDLLTGKVFDSRSFQDIEYDETLRVDRVSRTIDEIADALLHTYNARDTELHSIESLLGIRKTAVPQPVGLSAETNILLEAITGVKDQLLKTGIPPAGNQAVASDETVTEPAASRKSTLSWTDSEGNKFQIGDVVTHAKFGLGILVDIIPDGLLRIKFNTVGMKVLRGNSEKLILL